MDFSERFKHFDYEITIDKDFIYDRFGVPSELQREFESLYHKSLKGGEQIIRRLNKLIERYPHVPQLKNYLSVAHHNSGMKEEGFQINRQLTEEHPDYLFGKLSLAHEYYHQGEYGKIPEFLGELMEIQDLYPDRNRFHLSEVTGFSKMAIMYFCATGNLEAADARYSLLNEIAPGHPDTEQVQPVIMKARLEASRRRMEQEEKMRISVKTRTYDRTLQTKERPHLIHPETEWLYQYELDIEREKLEKILSLPRESLIADLRSVLKDAILRYEYFKDIYEKEKWDTDKLSFGIHAIFLLGELRATECLPDVLEHFRQDEEFIENWYGDHVPVSLWEPLYYLGSDQTDLLRDFALEPGIDSTTRSMVSGVLAQLWHHQPDRRGEVIGWFRYLFRTLSEAPLEANIIDSDFIGLAICDAMDIQAKELIPEIEELYRQGYVGQGICGTLGDVRKELFGPIQSHRKKELMNIYDRYNNILATWAGYQETQGTQEIQGTVKIGRNDPCPCGSGKKYKKCCL